MNNRDGKTTAVKPVSVARAAIERNTQIIRITLALTVLSFVAYAITLTSSHWVVITYPSDFFSVRHKLYIVRATYGVIWECILARPTATSMYGKY